MRSGDVKDLGVGIALLVGAGIAIYVISKLVGAGQSIVDATKKAEGYFFNTDPSAPASFGTDLYNAVHSSNVNIPVIDEAQAIKTCNALWKSKGQISGAICQTLYDQGKLTPPYSPDP